MDKIFIKWLLSIAILLSLFFGYLSYSKDKFEGNYIQIRDLLDNPIKEGRDPVQLLIRKQNMFYIVGFVKGKDTTCFRYVINNDGNSLLNKNVQGSTIVIKEGYYYDDSWYGWFEKN
jgi:hypothetical protein